MKKFTIFLAALLITTAGFFFGSEYREFRNLPPENSVTVTPTPSLSPAEISIPPEPEIGTPVTLSIPAIHVITNIESVGLDHERKMDVPQQVNNVAWYSLGFKPGEKGSAVIAGHLDTVTGAPAVFYYLHTLKPGDTITITDNNDQSYIFTVTQVQTYNFDTVPLEEIFNSTDKPRLNLITCEGIFNQTTRNYSQRTVVYPEGK